MIRRPAVAGMFYEADAQALRESITDCFLSQLGPRKLPHPTARGERRVIGLVCPHAGYMYSGPAAAHSYGMLAEDGIPEVAVILGPNHHGLGETVAVSTADKWETPLGLIEVDTLTARAIIEYSGYAQEDELAHAREHSIEVQIPFLQYIATVAQRTIRIVPIAIGHLGYSSARTLVADLGPAIAEALVEKDAVIIASTDLTHYESKARAQFKDNLALEQILSLNPDGLLRVVEEDSISMCGATGTAVMLAACKALGATSARRLAYYTSGDVTGDTRQVVGYASVAILAQP
ncbi:MAG: AmmeMemoRadiSam system protein B [Armatimonadota bacterium]|nr:AmmeMemoRadiSam system protein B [Armatimonadota bacterium]